MRLFLAFCIAGISVCTFGQQKLSRQEYIEKYKEISMEEMKRSGIPASITLAQGIIESGDGNSRLATKANNHFGIKCHDWKGPSIKHDDDAKNECFRKYKNPEESYKDHSNFLTSTKRYAFLFDLKPDDYKKWAKGLKEAGYATSSIYAKTLIKVIEENELYKYDQMVLTNYKPEKDRENHVSGELVAGNNREVMFNNRVKYIIADGSDTYERVSEELHLMSWQLTKYNESSKEDKLHAGDIIYLQPKRSKAEKKNKTHLVREGETLHGISQKYAVKERKLRVRNNIPEGEEPKPGVLILLRGKVNKEASAPETVKVEKQEKQEVQEHDRNSKKDIDQKKDNDSQGEDEFEIEFEL